MFLGISHELETQKMGSLDVTGYTLWWTNKKQLKMAIETVDFPINSMVIFHCYVSSPEGI